MHNRSPVDILQERGRVVARHYYANGGPGLGQAR